jgi:hypothetical protein
MESKTICPRRLGDPPDPQNEEALESETQVVRGYTATTRGWQATLEDLDVGGKEERYC